MNPDVVCWFLKVTSSIRFLFPSYSTYSNLGTAVKELLQLELKVLITWLQHRKIILGCLCVASVFTWTIISRRGQKSVGERQWTRWQKRWSRSWSQREKRHGCCWPRGDPQAREQSASLKQRNVSGWQPAEHEVLSGTTAQNWIL